MKEHAQELIPPLTLSGARIIARDLPLCPEIVLFLLSDDYPKEPIGGREGDAVLAAPPYWAFCWASGQALARHILDNPALVRNKTVLDFGSGSGVAALAAAKAGARRVVACDRDPSAQRAVLANAALNNTEVEICSEITIPPEHVFDVILAADVCYDPQNTHLLSMLAGGNLVLIADSRVKELPEDRFVPLEQLRLKTVPDLFEDEEFNNIVIYRSHDPTS